jgi:hypothetical protein
MYCLKYPTEIFGSKNYMNEGDSMFELILTNNVLGRKTVFSLCYVLTLSYAALI